MTLQSFQQFPFVSSFQKPTTPFLFNTHPLLPFLLHRSRPVGITVFPAEQRRRTPVVLAVDESQDSSEPEPSSSNQTLAESEDQNPPQSQPVELSDLASELKKAMEDRKGREEGKGNLWSGVAEEIREIEWPAFGKVLGTTGVVLSVILGSSVVLLTVNAILAELSDRAFAGRGVQDFFT